MADKTISSERKATYYAGMVFMAAGFLLFISNLLMAAGGFGEPTNRPELGTPEWHAEFDRKINNRASEMQGFAFRAVGGIGLIAFGGFLMRVGAAGLAGAGVVLDPQQARKDVEPWSRAVGGMVNDAASEIDAVKNLQKSNEPPPPVVKVRCRRCQTLNDEAARFCNQCAASL